MLKKWISVPAVTASFFAQANYSTMCIDIKEYLLNREHLKPKHLLIIFSLFWNMFSHSKFYFSQLLVPLFFLFWKTIMVWPIISSVPTCSTYNFPNFLFKRHVLITVVNSIYNETLQVHLRLNGWMVHITKFKAHTQRTYSESPVPGDRCASSGMMAVGATPCC